MPRSARRMFTTHTGRLPHPPNMREFLAARATDPAQCDALVRGRRPPRAGGSRWRSARVAAAGVGGQRAERVRRTCR
jgi:hypothetical protein